MRGHTQKVSR